MTENTMLIGKQVTDYKYFVKINWKKIHRGANQISQTIEQIEVMTHIATF